MADDNWPGLDMKFSPGLPFDELFKYCAILKERDEMIRKRDAALSEPVPVNFASQFSEPKQRERPKRPPKRYRPTVIGTSDEMIIELQEVVEGSELLEGTAVTHSTALMKLDLEVVEDFMFREDGVKLKRIEEFAKSRNGLLMDAVVAALKRANVRRFHDFQYLIYRLVFPVYPEPYSYSDIICATPTGTGKSLAYMIPVLQLALRKNKKVKKMPSSLILCPTKILASAAEKTLNDLIGELNVKVSCFIRPNRNNSRNYDIGIFTVGQFIAKMKAFPNDFTSVEIIVIDEADCMLNDFKFVQALKELREFTYARVMQFSATVNAYTDSIVDQANVFYIRAGQVNAVASIIKDKYFCVDWSKPSKVVASMDKFVYSRECKISRNPFDVLYMIVNEVKSTPKRMIVFVKRKDLAALIVIKLVLLGYRAALITASYGIEEQNLILDQYAKGKLDILVGSFLISRGIDFNAKHVVNFDLPLTYQDFIHRCGRAGRNGQKGYCHNFIDLDNADDCNPRVVSEIFKKLRERTAAGEKVRVSSKFQTYVDA